MGISITSMTGQQMQALGVVDSFDIASFTPGVSLGGSQAGKNTQFTIRGVTQTDFNDVVEAPTAVYLDDGYIAVAQGQTFAVFDIARVEILKGPQGTLFGRNATGGLIHYISNKPSLEGPEGYVDVKLGRFDTPAHANDRQVQAAASTPLSDTVAVRAAINYNDQDAYLKNLYPYGTSSVSGTGSAPDAGADLGDDKTLAGRLSLAWQASDCVDVALSANYADSDFATGPYQSKPVIGVYNGVNGGGELINVIDVAPGETRQSIAADGSDNGRDLADLGFLVDAGPRPVPGGDFFGYIDPDGDDFKTSSDYAFDGNSELETKGLNARVDWEISEDLTLTWVSDWKDYEKLMFLDVDAAPVNQLSNYAGVDGNSVTQELRLNGTADRMRWVAGLYYLNIDVESMNGLKAPNNNILAGPVLNDIFGLPPAVDIGVDAQMETDSYSLFGQVEYDLSDQWTLIAGLRGMREDKDYHMTNGFYLSTSSREIHQGGYLGGPIANYRDDSSDNLWTGKVQLDWKPTDDLLVYAGVNRGVKAGSYNAPLVGGYFAAGGDSALPYDEEILLSYEGGFKATFMDGLARLNGAVFYYDYQDYQAFLFTGVGGVVINRDAENIGAEFDLQISPAEGWDIMLGGSWYDAEVQDVPLVIGSSTTIDVKPTYAPEYQAFGLVRYEWSALSGTMAVQADFNYSDEFYYNLRNFDADKFDSYTVFNARISWLSAEENWELALAARNFTDERAGLMGYDLSNLCGCNETSFRDPRWYGVNVRYSF
ncbi:MAG: hypothetical protein CALGDGBN_03171 [Pseudomonadales bacterium]|nr:hypothetical protein [Pseudomonadales bacterium]